MTANEARKLEKKFKEPTTVAGVLAHIRRAAKIGFAMTTVSIPYKKEAFKRKVIKELEKKNFGVYLDSFDNGYLISIEW